MARAQFWANQWDQALRTPVDSGAKTYTGAAASPWLFTGTNAAPTIKTVNWTAAQLQPMLGSQTPFLPMMEVFFEFFCDGGTATAKLDCAAWGIPQTSYTTTMSEFTGVGQTVRQFISPVAGKPWGFREANGTFMSVSLTLSNGIPGPTSSCRYFRARLFWVPIFIAGMAGPAAPSGEFTY
jgi:hypothetical protein